MGDSPNIIVIYVPLKRISFLKTKITFENHMFCNYFQHFPINKDGLVEPIGHAQTALIINAENLANDL